MPLVVVTDSASTTGKNFEVRVAGVIYQVVVNSTADLYLDKEHLAPFTTAVQAARNSYSPLAHIRGRFARRVSRSIPPDAPLTRIRFEPAARCSRKAR